MWLQNVFILAFLAHFNSKYHRLASYARLEFVSLMWLWLPLLQALSVLKPLNSRLLNPSSEMIMVVNLRDLLQSESQLPFGRVLCLAAFKAEETNLKLTRALHPEHVRLGVFLLQCRRSSGSTLHAYFELIIFNFLLLLLPQFLVVIRLLMLAQSILDNSPFFLLNQNYNLSTLIFNIQ